MGLLSEYINKKLSSIDLEQELLRLISEYNKLRKSYLFVYSSAISKPIPKSSICMDDYYIIYDLLKNVKSDNLDFYIETPGGSGEAAEEIVNFLRKTFKNITFVVSGEAKSAGTIMTLSADDIMMTESGSLGPIDAQIKIGRSQSSAYDYMEWIKEKRSEAEKVGKLNPFDATMVAQISPGELNGVDNALNFATDLVADWLPKYKFKNWKITDTRKIKVTKEMKEKRAKEIVERLVNHTYWRSHGRSIKIDGLEKIGLKISKIDDNKTLADLVYRIQTVISLLYSVSSIYKIFATQEDKIFASATSINEVQRLPMNPQQINVAELNVKCDKCGEEYKIYAKLDPNPKIDEDMKKKGFSPIPKNGKLKCKCGFEIDLMGIINNIETQIGKKVILD